MKRFFSGIIVGVLLMLPLYAFADQISMIGKKIEGEYPVFLNGKELEVSAPVLDGTSFLPVRVIGEALNLDVDFDDKEGRILLDRKIINPNPYPGEYDYGIITTNLLQTQTSVEYYENLDISGIDEETLSRIKENHKQAKEDLIYWEGEKNKVDSERDDFIKLDESEEWAVVYYGDAVKAYSGYYPEYIEYVLYNQKHRLENCYPRNSEDPTLCTPSDFKIIKETYDFWIEKAELHEVS